MKKLKVKSIRILVRDKKNNQEEKLMKINIVLFSIILINCLRAANDNGLALSNQNTMFSDSQLQFQIFSPYLNHNSLLNDENGFSIGYQYPGFYNGVSGQVQLSYTTLSKDSYSFGFGWFNINFGINKKLFNVENNTVYLNIYYGYHHGHSKKFITIDNSNAIIGLSNKITGVKKNLNIDISINGFLHTGQSGDLTPFIPYTRGIVSNINISHTFSGSFAVSYGLGIAIVQYRYSNNEYITYNIENNHPQYYSIKNPKWDNFLIIPFGLSIGYNF